ncbi:MAG: hypothetical protein M1816_004669 [Peltula sp. TS41687]|nr:MAG: hypothetical protein M1816_004669 [Peltula sp. TS41687]
MTGEKGNTDLHAESLVDQVHDLVGQGQREVRYTFPARLLIVPSLTYDSQEASRVSREAVSIAPEHHRVREAFTQLQRDEDIHPFLTICRRYAREPDSANATRVCEYLQNEDAAALPPAVADESTSLLFGRCTTTSDDGDRVLSSLLRHSPNARAYMARQLGSTTTDTVFEWFWHTGDSAVNELVTVLLDGSAWTAESTRQRCEGDVFMLFIAKLMEAGQDQEHMERGLRGLARLFLVDAARLHMLVDADVLEVILSALDMRLPGELRSRATLITAKYLEAAQEAGQDLLTHFITSRLARATNDNLSVAFSVAAAVFPMMPAMAAKLFLAERFVESVVTNIQKKAKSTRVKQAALEMFSAACIDRNCRLAVKRYCSGWLEELVNAAEEPSASIAALVLAKIRGADDDDDAQQQDEKRVEDLESVVDLVQKFKDMMMVEEALESQRSIEGLAYTSLQPAIKEELAHDKAFLTNLVHLLRCSSGKQGLIFGVSTILVNLTKYLPTLSAEEKHMSQLKAYANASKTKSSPDPLDDTSHVTSRCKLVLDSGIVAALLPISKSLTTRTHLLISTLFLSLSKEPKHRGALAQQGAAKLLLHLYASTTGPSASAVGEQTRHTSAHALARILISIDPALLFPPPSSSTPLRPLLSLLSDDDPTTTTASDHRDHLPTFEALLALTNLCSVPDAAGIHSAIVAHAWPRIEDLLLSTHPLLQRAATELVCNLASSGGGAAPFLESPNRVAILLALADSDDLATRRAAGGALVMLTEESAVVVKALLDRETGVKVLLGLCEDDDEACRLRGVLCFANLCEKAPADVDVEGRMRREGGEVADAVLRGFEAGLEGRLE